MKLPFCASSTIPHRNGQSWSFNLITLDLSSAFYTLDHDILINSFMITGMQVFAELHYSGSHFIFRDVLKRLKFVMFFHVFSPTLGSSTTLGFGGLCWFFFHLYSSTLLSWTRMACYTISTQMINNCICLLKLVIWISPGLKSKVVLWLLSNGCHQIICWN